jgi:hypothetical protein
MNQELQTRRDAEKTLRSRYPQQKIKRGSWLPGGASEAHGNKATLVILCQDCGGERRIATSDCFQTVLCVDCHKAKKGATKSAKTKSTKTKRTKKRTTA